MDRLAPRQGRFPGGGLVTATRPLSREDRDVLWREWRHCEDERWAAEIYRRVGATPVDWRVPLGFVVAWSVVLGLAGLGIDVHRRSLAGWLGMPFSGALTGLVIGAAIGIHLWACRRRRGPVSSSEWLTRLLPWEAGPWMFAHLSLPPIVAILWWADPAPRTGEIWISTFAGLGILMVVSVGRAGILVQLATAALLGHTVAGLWAGAGRPEIGLPSGILIALLAALPGFEPGRSPVAPSSSLLPYRWMMLGWRRRPSRLAVAAVARGLDGDAWSYVRALLEDPTVRGSSSRRRVTTVEEGDWPERLVACLDLEQDDGRSVLALRSTLRRASRVGPGAQPMETQLGERLVRRLWWETRSLGGEPERHVCPACWLRPRRLRDPMALGHASFRLRRLDYVGCPGCGRASGWIDWPGEIVAVLDDGRRLWSRTTAGPLVVNALRHRAPFDFDRVEILRTTDAEVEAFAIRLLEDDDRAQRARRRRLRCTVSTECGLSGNTQEALRRVFGEVWTGETEIGVDERLVRDVYRREARRPVEHHPEPEPEEPVRSNPRRPSPHRFTLIELLVVVAVIGIVAAIVIPLASGTRCGHGRKEDMANLQRIAAELERRYAEAPHLGYTNGAGRCPGRRTYRSSSTIPDLPIAIQGDRFAYTIEVMDPDGDRVCERYELTARGVREPVKGRILGLTSEGVRTGDWR